MNKFSEESFMDVMEYESLSGLCLVLKKLEVGEVFSIPKNKHTIGIGITESQQLEFFEKEECCPSEFLIVGEGNSIQEKVSSVLNQENKLFINLLLRASTIFNKPLIYNQLEEFPDFTKEKFDALIDFIRGQVEQHRVLVERMLLSQLLFTTNLEMFKDSLVSLDSEKGLEVFNGTLGKKDDLDIMCYSPHVSTVPAIFGLPSNNYLGYRTIRYASLIDDKLSVQGSMLLPDCKVVSVGITHDYVNANLNFSLEKTKLNDPKSVISTHLSLTTENEISKLNS